MELLIGRVTADAKVTELKENQKVVNFSIALNKRYRLKATGEWKNKTTYVECSYWVNPGIAEYLRSGEMVELTGDLDVRAYIDKQGEAKGVITFHVDKIVLHGGRKTTALAQTTAAEITEPVDDLPF